eukprot:gene12896-9227_t
MGNHSCCSCSSSVDPLRPREPPPATPYRKGDSQAATQLSHTTTATSSLDHEQSPSTAVVADAAERADPAGREEAFRHAMDQLFAAVPAGSTDVFDVLFTQFASSHRLAPSEIAHYLQRCLCSERRWYRYRDILPASCASPPWPAGDRDAALLASPSTKESLSKMVATDMTIVQIAGVFGGSAFIDHVLAVLVYAAAMATGATAAAAATQSWPAIVAQVEAALAVVDPVFGMTAAHMMLLAQQGAALVRLLTRLLRWDAAGPAALAAVVDTVPTAWRALFVQTASAPPVAPLEDSDAEAAAPRSLLLSVCATATTAGKTLLHLVVEERDAAALQAIARALIDLLQSTATATHAASVLALWTRAEGRHGHTPLHVAATQANWAAFEVAIDHFVELLRLSVLRQVDALAQPTPPSPCRSRLVTMADLAAVLRATDDDGDDVRAMLQRQLAAVRHERDDGGGDHSDGHSDGEEAAAPALSLREDDALMRLRAIERCLALLDAFDVAASMPATGALDAEQLHVECAASLLRVDVTDFPTGGPPSPSSPVAADGRSVDDLDAADADGRCQSFTAVVLASASLRASPVGWMCQQVASAFSSPARSTAASERMLSTHSSTGGSACAATDDDDDLVAPVKRTVDVDAATI